MKTQKNTKQEDPAVGNGGEGGEGDYSRLALPANNYLIVSTNDLVVPNKVYQSDVLSSPTNSLRCCD